MDFLLQVFKIRALKPKKILHLDFFDNSGLDEDNAILDDENLLQTLPKIRHKKLKTKQG